MDNFVVAFNGSYNSLNNSVDLDKLNGDLIAKYVPDYGTKSGMTDYYNDWNNNILLTYKDRLTSILSKEATDLICSFIENKKNSNHNYDILKEKIRTLNSSDQEILNYILNVTEFFKTRLLVSNNQTKAVSGFGCNAMYSVMGSITGSIWGAAFAGPVGWCVAAAWGLAATAVAYYEC